MRIFTREEVERAFELARRATWPPARLDDKISVERLTTRMAEALNAAPGSVRIEDRGCPKKWITVYVGVQRFG